MAAQQEKNLLILTDFSPQAWQALNYARFIFKDQPTHFHLLHLYTPNMVQSRFMATSVATGSVEDTALGYAKKELQRLAAHLAKENTLKHHRFTTEHSFNLLVCAVKEAVSETFYDMVVMGSKGHSGLEAAFMGSQTHKLIKGSIGVPILAVPEQVNFEPPKAMAFATDFSRFFAASELTPLVSLAKDFKASIQIVHVKEGDHPPTEAQEFNMFMLYKYLEDLPFESHRIGGVHKIAQSLGSFSETHGIHLLAFLNYHHSFLEDLSKEAIAKKLLHLSTSPLFVLPEMGMTKGVFKKQTNTLERKTPKHKDPKLHLIK